LAQVPMTVIFSVVGASAPLDLTKRSMNYIMNRQVERSRDFIYLRQ